jgi:hypothetical protein
MTTRMTAQRLGRLIAAGDVAAVRTAVTDQPRLLERTVERDGQNGWTPLHVAVAENQPEIVDLLIDAGADLAARTEHARTPLHVALEHAPDLVDRLRKHGAVVDAPSAAFLDDVEQLTRELDAGCCSSTAPTPTAAPCTPRPPTAGWSWSGCSSRPGPTSTGGIPTPGAPRCTPPWRPARAAMHRRSCACCSPPAPTSTPPRTTAPAPST